MAKMANLCSPGRLGLAAEINQGRDLSSPFRSSAGRTWQILQDRQTMPGELAGGLMTIGCARAAAHLWLNHRCAQADITMLPHQFCNHEGVVRQCAELANHGVRML